MDLWKLNGEKNSIMTSMIVYVDKLSKLNSQMDLRLLVDLVLMSLCLASMISQ